MSGSPPFSALLIVEDNGAMRSLIRSLVEDLAASVHECEDGSEAVKLYDTLLPDCVLMDIKLGGLDGIAATRAIRRLHPRARVIIVTEQPDEQYRGAATDAGAVGFLLKEDLLDLPEVLAEVAAMPAEEEPA